MRRLGSGVTALDMFCGYGGSSQGIVKAGADLRIAVNHDAMNIKTHSANYADIEHLQADLNDAGEPIVITESGKKVPGRYVDPATLPAVDFLWASPSCKFHSPANAKKIYERGPQAVLFDDGEEFDQVAYANSERSRVTMLCPLRYAAKHLPGIVVVENVVEAAKWGPSKDGSTFRWWLREWQKIGYTFRCLFLNSGFFPPCPQSRDRMYVVFWRKGSTAPDLDYRPRAYCTSNRCGGRHVDAVQSWKKRSPAWPIEEWGKYRSQYLYRCPDCNAEVDPAAWPALSVIDWTNLGPSLAERRELGTYPAANTVDRMRRAYSKLGRGPAIVLPTKSVWGVDTSVLDQFRAQTTQQDRALVTGGMVAQRTNAAGQHFGEPMPTLTTAGHGGIGMVIKHNGGAHETHHRGKSAIEPFGALTAHPTQQVALGPAIMPAAGNTHERPGQTRVRHAGDQMFTQHGTMSFGVSSLVEMRGGGSVESGQHSVAEPAHTVTAGGMHHLLATAGFTKINGGPDDTAWHPTTDPLNTVTARDTHGLVVIPWIEQWQSDPIVVTDQLATVMSHLRHSLVTTEPIPLEHITDEVLDQMRFRMLQPDPELRGAMAFAPSYILLGSQSRMTAGLGNAVTPPVSEWITDRCLRTLGGGSTNEKIAA